MLNFWKKKNKESSSGSTHGANELSWSSEASAGLDQALAQAPVPALLKNKVRGELKGAAEAVTRTAGRTEVTPQDLMAGMLSKMPASMRSKVEAAMKEGPAGLEKLQNDLKNSK